jgi:hypothetical protein
MGISCPCCIQITLAGVIMDGRRSTDDLIKDLWQWAFGNGRPGIEDRVKCLEDRQLDNATRADVEALEKKVHQKIDRLETKIDGIRAAINFHEILKLVVIVGAVLVLLKGGV